MCTLQKIIASEYYVELNEFCSTQRPSVVYWW